MTVQPETFMQKQLRKKAEREAAARPAMPPRTDGSNAIAVAADNPRAARWIETKLAAQLERLRGAQEGERNQILYSVAVSLGQRIPAYLDEQHITEQLTLAAREIGLEPRETSLTIRSGLTKGMSDPLPVTLSDNVDGLADLVAGPVQAAPARVDPATGEIAEPDNPDDALELLVRQTLVPLDWHELWADDSLEEWIVEPILPARRLVALYSAPKVGKSLLMLELAVGVARGTAVLGMTPDRARRVLYIDFENDPKADVRERLQAMGVGPDDLGGLRYLSFPTLAALDSDRGGRELLAAVRVHGCEVVVVDTVSRSIAGEENENDTWLSFYRHTGLRLKQEGVALIRLDHSGKDETKGQRGGSAKSGDVDAVWRLSRVTDDTFRLDCEAARMPVAERTLVLHRRQGPLRHTVDAEGRSAAFKAEVESVVRVLDEAGVPRGLGRDLTKEAVKKIGLRAGTAKLAAVVKARNGSLEEAEKPVPGGRGQVPSDDLSPRGRGQVGTGDDW